MNTTTAIITRSTLVVVERNEAGLVCRTLLEIDRPASLAEVETELAFVSLGLTSGWDLEGENIAATVTPVDNRFNGTVAAKLDRAVGTTHEAFEIAAAQEVENGDLVSDMELCGIAVVAGCSTDGDVTKIHQVTEGKTWEDRYTGHFIPRQFVMRARRKA